MRLPRLLLIPVLFGSLLTAIAAEEAKPLTKVPANISDLKALQSRVQEVYKKVTPAVVGIRIGEASGSGVIVSEDGYVLTAGHVSGQPDTECTLIFPDGKKVKGKSLGNNRFIDSGMIKITEPGKWPFVPMNKVSKTEKGQWVVSLGHPNGYISGRSPVLRLGRVINATDSLIQTDCTLVGGDSGGPLFDLEGRVIGIHSRIGPMITFNVHVPVATYTDQWEDLVAGRIIGRSGRSLGGVDKNDFGAKYELTGGILRISEVRAGSLAEKAGLKVKDLIAKVDGKPVATAEEIAKIVKAKKNGDELVVEVDRGIERLTLKVLVKS